MARPTRITVIGAAAFAVLVLLGGFAASAATRVNVGLSQSLRMSVKGSASSVVVSNPTIADVTVVDAHSVIVLGKGYGATQIMVFDMKGRLLLDSVVTVTAPQQDQITLHRGVTANEFTCSPRCEPDSAKSATADAAAQQPPS
jgi:Flp pilus assembly secretin CpaC